MLELFLSNQLVLLLYQLCLIEHVFSLDSFLILDQLIHKLFGLNLFWKKSGVVLFILHGLYSVPLHHLLDLLLVVQSFYLLLVFYNLLFLLLRKEVLLEMVFKDLGLLLISSSKSCLVAFKLYVLSPYIFWHFGYLILWNECTLVRVLIRIHLFNLPLFDPMRQVNRSAQSFSFLWIKPISKLWRCWDRSLLRFRHVLLH